MNKNLEDQKIQNEINSFIDIILHLDSYLFKGQNGLNSLNQKISKLKLSKNSQDLISQIIESSKISHYFCFNEKIKEIRNNQGIMKAINEIFKSDQGKVDNKLVIRKINTYSFNQPMLNNNHSFYGSEAELYFLKNFIHNKILNILKGSFEMQFDKKNEKTKNMNNNYLNNRTKFILISHSCLKNAKLMNEYILNNQKLSLNNNFIKLNNSKALNPIDFKYYQNNIKKYDLIMNDTSQVFNFYKNPQNSSIINSSNFNLNKNSSSSYEKSSNKINDFNTIDISKNNNKKNIFIKKNKILLNKRKSDSQDKSTFLPVLNIQDHNYKRRLKFKHKKVPSFSSERMELINYNTKNNIKIKAQKTFLDECIKESYRSLRKINDLQRTKCFVDYSKSSITSDKINIGKKEEAPPKEKRIFPSFEYKSIYKYTFNGRLPRTKKKFHI